VAVVVGAGNLLRGRDLTEDPHVARSTADAMGMMATVINALALRDSLSGRDVPAVAMGAFKAGPYLPEFSREAGIAALEAGKVVICAGGTGNPYFTTDTCATLRAAQLGCEVVLKATKVDGVYDRDPQSCPEAERFETLTFSEALQRDLGVMDAAAFSMCRDSGLEVLVFRFADKGNLQRAVRGEAVGTLVSGSAGKE
jgi:uridylate kinase